MRARGEVVMARPVDADVVSRADPFVVLSLERDCGQALFGFARRLGLSDEDAADAVQEGLLRLWAILSRGDQLRDPEAMVFRIVFRLAMDHHRLRRRMVRLAARLTSKSRDLEAAEEGTGDIWRLVEELPTRQRQTLYLR